MFFWPFRSPDFLNGFPFFPPCASFFLPTDEFPKNFLTFSLPGWIWLDFPLQIFLPIETSSFSKNPAQTADLFVCPPIPRVFSFTPPRPLCSWLKTSRHSPVYPKPSPPSVFHFQAFVATQKLLFVHLGGSISFRLVIFTDHFFSIGLKLEFGCCPAPKLLPMLLPLPFPPFFFFMGNHSGHQPSLAVGGPLLPPP